MLVLEYREKRDRERETSPAESPASQLPYDTQAHVAPEPLPIRTEC